MTRPQKAKELFFKGYNCSQAVLGAFAEDFGIDSDTLFKLSSSFGGGMGRMREVCGAVTGAFMVAGLKCGYSDPSDKAAKIEHYALIQKIAADFKEQNGSIICRELLEGAGCNGQLNGFVPDERTKTYYKKRPCAELVEIAAGIVEKELY